MEDLVDFSECEFISNTMKFYTYKDFRRNCFIIKSKFKNLSRNGKLFYMWYLYANTHMAYNSKSKIWDYLNDYIGKDELDD